MSNPRATQLIEAGLWLKLGGDLAGARRLFEQALQLDPENARAKLLLEEGAKGALPQELVQASLTPLPNNFELPPSSMSSPPIELASAWDEHGPEQVVEARHEPHDALGLLEQDARRPEAPQDELEVLLTGIDDLIALDDHSSALELLQKAEALAPGHPEVLRRRTQSEAVVEQMLQSRLGTLTRRPIRKLKDDEIIWLNLDHRAGFVLAQIDGTVTYDDLFALSGMSRIDTAKILVQLLDEGAIEAEG